MGWFQGDDGVGQPTRLTSKLIFWCRPRLCVSLLWGFPTADYIGPGSDKEPLRRRPPKTPQTRLHAAIYLSQALAGHLNTVFSLVFVQIIGEGLLYSCRVARGYRQPSKDVRCPGTERKGLINVSTVAWMQLRGLMHQFLFKKQDIMSVWMCVCVCAKR